jgi:5-methyltetrahydrofolate--homocysteine methyltransferase
VAKEMTRQKFTVPLLIGGATTSHPHASVKVAPQYSPGVVHVLDASRVVNVVSALLSPEQKPAFLKEVEAKQASARADFEARRVQRKLLTLNEARARRQTYDWSKVDIAKPELIGTRAYNDVPLQDLVPFIDWGPFFNAWELFGAFPKILEDEKVGAEAKKLYADAQTLLARIIKEKRFKANAVIGFWPANSVGDTVELYSDEQRTKVVSRFHMLRQQAEKQPGQFNLSLADFIAPRDSGRIDYFGGFAVTAGLGVEEFAQSFRKQHDDYSAIMVQALGDRLAEAFAEYMHKQARVLSGFGRSEDLTNEQLIREEYRGIRPAPGYPACPEHSEKGTLFALLNAQSSGITLTESFAMNPASSVSGFYLNHPDAKYFGLGKIGRDQVEDYAARKGWSYDEAAKWLGPSLDEASSGSTAAA